MSGVVMVALSFSTLGRARIDGASAALAGKARARDAVRMERATGKGVP